MRHPSTNFLCSLRHICSGESLLRELILYIGLRFPRMIAQLLFVVSVWLLLLRETAGAAMTLPLRVTLQTCVITDAGSPSTAFKVAFTFPTTGAILSVPAVANFQKDPYYKNNWYTVFETTMSVDAALFTTAISSQITITAQTWEGVCINKLTVNGVSVSGALPKFVDSPCDPIHEGYTCGASFVGTFQLTPPLYPVTIRYTSCDVAWAASTKHFLLELLEQNMQFTLFNVPSRGVTAALTIYLKSYMQSQTMRITAQQDESWCLDTVTVENRPTTFVGTWINSPCGSGSSGYTCTNPVTFTFTLGAPTTMPTLKPTVIITAPPSSSKPSTKPTAVPTAPTAKPTSAMPTYTVTQCPTAKPTTAVPTFTVTQNPTAIPSTARPTARPSAAPSNLPDSLVTSILSSPTYKPRCGFGFAAIDPSTSAVLTWGMLSRHATVEDDGLTHAVVVAHSAGVQVVAGHSAFAARLTDGTITAWGASSVLEGGAEVYGGLSLRVLVANDGAFAGITTDGGVFAFGSEHSGGNVVDDTKCNGYSAELGSGILSIIPSSAAFAAITTNSDVYAWGSKYTGGGVSTLTRPELSSVTEVVATRGAFAAITSSRSVVTWGDKRSGGDSSTVASQLTSDVMHVIASQSVFVAFKYDGSLVVWGNSLHGGDITAVAPLLAGDIKFVNFNTEAMAAVKTDGSVVAWGLKSSGGDAAAVASLHNIAKIYHTKYAFAALTSSGGVVAWGEANEGGLIPSALVSALSSDVVSIFSTDRAFAALKSTGAVVVWGNPHFGGSAGAAAPYLTSGVTAICANDVAFTAIKSDGTAVVWGHSSSIPYPGVLSSVVELRSVVNCA